MNNYHSGTFLFFFLVIEREQEFLNSALKCTWYRLQTHLYRSFFKVSYFCKYMKSLIVFRTCNMSSTRVRDKLNFFFKLKTTQPLLPQFPCGFIFCSVFLENFNVILINSRFFLSYQELPVGAIIIIINKCKSSFIKIVLWRIESFWRKNPNKLAVTKDFIFELNVKYLDV